ncbi:MAG: FixH family protein [Azoarcus sp.]|jgi:hypothetical protein|nr:FixH family protein [Azoarcus sp.]
MQAKLNRPLSSVVALFMFCAFCAGAHAAPEEIVAKFDAWPPETVTVNQFYECALTATDANGVGKTGLHLQVRGRMPEHAHGLPTAPQISEEGQGRYRIKGLSFNMPGRWVIDILRDDVSVLRQELTVRF